MRRDSGERLLARGGKREWAKRAGKHRHHKANLRSRLTMKIERQSVRLACGGRELEQRSGAARVSREAAAAARRGSRQGRAALFIGPKCLGVRPREGCGGAREAAGLKIESRSQTRRKKGLPGGARVAEREGARGAGVAAPTNLSRLKSARSTFYKDNPANALKTEQIR